MKLKKTKKTYCKTCKKHTTHKVSQVKSRERGSLKKGSLQRAFKRGRGQGYGNLGRYGSKPAISKFKRTGSKISKKTNLKFQCDVCNKSSIQSKGFRVKRLELE